MKKDYMEACMNSTRQRIIQVIMINKEATSAEIGEELQDIPRASLYRHIKVLLDAGIITVVKEEFKSRSGIEGKKFKAKWCCTGYANEGCY